MAGHRVQFEEGTTGVADHDPFGRVNRVESRSSTGEMTDDLEGWMKKLEKDANRIENNATREIVQKAIERAQGRINKPSPAAPPRP